MTKILTLDHYQQTTDYTCGPATLLSFLSYHDKRLSNKHTEKKLSKLLKTCPIVGTQPIHLYEYLKQTGKNFKLMKKAGLKNLQENIDNDHPSIVLWYDETEWHWSTAVGYDQNNIILLDPYLQDGLHSIDKHTFNQYWSKLAIK